MDNPLPHIYNLEQLKGLDGAPRITFPDGNLNVKQVERVIKVPIEAAWDAFLSTEGYEAEFAGTKLVFQQQLDNDHIYKRIYQRWTTLPGSELEATTVGGDWRSQFAKDGEIVTTTQPVESGIEQLADGNKVVSGQINPTDNNQSTISVSEAPGGFVPIVDLAYGADQWRRFAADGNVTITKTLVNKGTAPDTGALVISSEVIAQSDAEDLSAIKTTVSGSSLVPLISYNLADPEAKGRRTRTTETPVATGTSAGTTGFGILDSRIVALNAKQSIQIVKEAIDGFPTLTEYDRDPETRSLITITHEIIAATTPPTSTLPPGTIEVIKPIDKDHSLRVTTVYSLPSSYTMQVHVGENMPTLLHGYGWNDACGTFVSARHGFSCLAEGILEVSFSTAQVSTAIPQLKPNTFKYGGFNVSNVLNDEGTMVYTGKCVGSITFPASTPSKTDYLANWAGQYVIRSAESKPWRNTGLWRTEILKVKMQ